MLGSGADVTHDCHVSTAHTVDTYMQQLHTHQLGPKWQLNHFMHLYITKQQSPHWLQGDAPHPPPKLPLTMRQLPIPTNCLILGPSQHTTPNGIQIQSVVFTQYTEQTDRQMGHATTKPVLIPAYALCDNTMRLTTEKLFGLNGLCANGRQDKHSNQNNCRDRPVFIFQ